MLFRSALGAVIAQGILGGLTVLFFLPAPISISHAGLAQLVFCLTLTIAIVTSPGWHEGYQRMTGAGEAHMQEGVVLARLEGERRVRELRGGGAEATIGRVRAATLCTTEFEALSPSCHA